MKVSVHFKEENDILKGFIEGEIDTYTASVLRQELDLVEIEENQKIEINLSKVSYLDSTGLGIFVAFYKRVVKGNAHLKFVDLTPRLMRLFEITGLSDLMVIEHAKKNENGEKVELSNERF